MTIINGRQRVTLGKYNDHVGLRFHLTVVQLSYQHIAAGRPLSNQGFT